MTQKHPITPSQDLIHKWFTEAPNNLPSSYEQHIAIQAAQWGADQELDACCEWLNREVGTGWGHGTKLRAARRPKPPSLKEQALEALDSLCVNHTHENIIRRALESLPD